MSEDFEKLVRRRLHEASELAPDFRFDPDEPLRTPDPVRKRPRWMLAVAAAAALVVLVGAGSVVAHLFDPGSRVGSSVSCANVLTFDGRHYEPVNVVRLPKPGRDLGTATTCSDTVANGTPAAPDRVRIQAVPGVTADWAFSSGDQVWLADRQDDIPAGIRALQRPIRCLPTVDRLSGTVVELDGRAVDDDPPRSAPYTITLEVTGKDLVGLHATQYRAVLVRIKVTDTTAGAGLVTRLSNETERNSPLSAQVVCAGAGFRATKLTLG